LSTPMNTLAVEVERRYERPIMCSFHACFSLGQLGGGLAGVLAASVGIAPALQLTVTNTMLAGALLATVRWLPDDRPAAVEGRPAGTRGPRSAVGGPTGSAAGSVAPRGSGLRTLTPQLALLAGIALLTSINEGAAVQWSAQYGAVTLAAGAGIGALTFSCFSVAMTTSRLFGDRIVNRLGRARFLRFSALLAAAGMAVGLLVGTTTSAFVAFALLGAGSACIVPTVVGLAGNQPGIPAGRGVAAVSFGQWPAYLIGPPIIGAVAGLVGLRSALGVLVIAALAIAVLAGRVREPIAPDDPPLTIEPSTIRALDDSSPRRFEPSTIGPLTIGPLTIGSAQLREVLDPVLDVPGRTRGHRCGRTAIRVDALLPIAQLHPTDLARDRLG